MSLSPARPRRPLTAAETLIEARRHTRDLRSAEFRYLLRHVQVPACKDPELRQQVVTDAVLYYAQEGHELPEGGERLSYYLHVKAQNLFLDAFRAERAGKRGEGKVYSLEGLRSLAVDAAPDQDFLAGLGQRPGFDVALDAERVRRAVLAALAPFPDKLRLFELHLEGFTPADITLQLGWAAPDPVTGKLNSSRARKALFDAQAHLVKVLPALAALRPGKGPAWGEGEGQGRAARFLSSEACEGLARAQEGPVGRKDARKFARALALAA